jgi:hypothetical protein
MPTKLDKLHSPDLAALGLGSIVYVRAHSAAEARVLFPSVTKLPAKKYYVVKNAAGDPIALADTEDTAIWYAVTHAMSVQRVH